MKLSYKSKNFNNPYLLELDVDEIGVIRYYLNEHVDYMKIKHGNFKSLIAVGQADQTIVDNCESEMNRVKKFCDTLEKLMKTVKYV